jgi:hypothetical protein
MREEYRRLIMGIEDQLVRWIPATENATATEQDVTLGLKALS